MKRPSLHLHVPSFWSVLLPLLAISAFAVSPASPEPRLGRALGAMDSSVTALMKAVSIPGLSVAVCRDSFQWSAGYGYADLEDSARATPATSYVLASLMKPMTALAVVRLAALGKVSLDSTIQRYVPYYPEKSWRVTVRQLLGHLAGIGCRDFRWEPGTDKVPYTAAECVALFKDCDLLFEPGSRFEYSSWGYDLLGALIEEVNGESFEKHMAEHIWRPLGMTGTSLDTRALVPHRARGYEVADGRLRNSPWVDNSLWFAAGGGRSTVLDLIRFSRGLDDGAVLTTGEQQAMYRSMTTTDGKKTGYGMGWGTAKVGGADAVFWVGSQPGTTTVLLRVPSQRLTVAMACNLGDLSQDFMKIAFRFAGWLLE